MGNETSAQESTDGEESENTAKDTASMNDTVLSSAFDAAETLENMNMAPYLKAAEMLGQMDVKPYLEAAEMANQLRVEPYLEAAENIKHMNAILELNTIESLNSIQNSIFTKILRNNQFPLALNALENIQQDAEWNAIETSLRFPQIKTETAPAVGQPAVRDRITATPEQTANPANYECGTESDIERYLSGIEARKSFSRTYSLLMAYGDEIDNGTLLFMASQLIGLLAATIGGPLALTMNVLGTLLAIIEYLKEED